MATAEEPPGPEVIDIESDDVLLVEVIVGEDVEVVQLVQTEEHEPVQAANNDLPSLEEFTTAELIPGSEELGGYRYNFVDKVCENYKCPICLLVLQKPEHIADCGHVFCASCLTEWIAQCEESDTGITCPVDNQEFDEDRRFDDLRVTREIGGLMVWCENKVMGCECKSELRDYVSHLAKCEYRCTDCPLGCGQVLLDWSMAYHVADECPRRLLSCPLCDQSMEARAFTNHEDECPMKSIPCDYCFGSYKNHEDECPMKSIPCDYCFGGVFFRKDMQEHIDTNCPDMPTYCVFAPLGCTQQIVRKDLNKHHKKAAQQHLGLLSSAAVDLYETLGLTAPNSSPNANAAKSETHNLEIARHLLHKFRIRDDVSIKTKLSDWSELPRNVYEENVKSNANKITSLAEIVESVAKLEKRHVSEIVTVKKSAAETVDEVNELKAKIGYLTVKNEKYEKDMKTLTDENKKLGKDLTELKKLVDKLERDLGYKGPYKRY